jgi:3-hydroxybutyryl-CoA dehydrogenase
MDYQLDTGTIVAIIGAGSMGGGIAQVAASAGHRVRLYDAQPGATTKAIERIAADLAGGVQRKRIDERQRDMVLSAIAPVDRLEELESCNLVIEAIAEQLEPKQLLFRELEHLLPRHAVFTTNTSSISITAIAQGMQHPQRLVGWHFFNPAPRMKLVEIVRGLETDPMLAALMRTLSRAWGKTPVNAPNAPGFIVNRVARPYYGEALRLLAEGLAAVPAIDRLFTEAGGFALGPFELIDLIGVDVNQAVTDSVFEATQWDTRYAPHPLQLELVRAGHYGRKTGRGFYDYRPGAVKPLAPSLVPGVAPGAVLRVAHDMGLLTPLVVRLRMAGLDAQEDAALPAGVMAFDDTRVALTDGRTATERAATDLDGARLLLLDLARDFSTTRLVGAAASAGAEADLSALAAVLARVEIGLLTLGDVAGLGVMRTVCQLANEACDLMTWTGTGAADVDIAMVLGTAYPIGPLAWADALGASNVLQVLANLQVHYGDPRYRRSPRLLRAHFARQSLHV